MTLTTPGDPAPLDGTGLPTLSATMHATPDGALRVVVSGEIDMVTVGTLRDALGRAIARRPDRLELDLAGVTFLGSAGIGVLAVARRALGDITLVGGNDQVRRILGMFGVIDTTEPPKRP
jgi:anti-sigma B factor antagonist